MPAPIVSASNTPQSATLEQPHSLLALFLAFNHVALQGFGGVLTIIQREMVDKRRWLTQQQFVEDWAVSQILPGGNVINLCIILGNRYFGWRGAVVALAGILVVPCCWLWCWRRCMRSLPTYLRWRAQYAV